MSRKKQVQIGNNENKECVYFKCFVMQERVIGFCADCFVLSRDQITRWLLDVSGTFSY